MFRLLASGIALVGLMVLTAIFAQSAGSDPALTRADSVLPPPILEHPFYLNTAEARRFIRWDCSDWSPRPAVADAENELASAILETLAANRGKTLYCALDQSDTWTKRQVYDHAHAHNDRDRTQYDGSQGQGRFRGFTAGQEGWLTDGEHGITGVSPERIFEFPQEERRRRRRWVTKEVEVTSDPPEAELSSDNRGRCPDDNGRFTSPNYAEEHTSNGNLICTNYGGNSDGSFAVWGTANRQAQNVYAGVGNALTNWRFDWRTRAITAGSSVVSSVSGNTLSEQGWKDKAEAAVIAACADLGSGYKYKKGSADFGRGHNHDVTGNSQFTKGPHHGWFFSIQHATGNSGPSKRQARESRTWHGTCYKRFRR